MRDPTTNIENIVGTVVEKSNGAAFRQPSERNHRPETPKNTLNCKTFLWARLEIRAE